MTRLGGLLRHPVLLVLLAWVLTQLCLVVSGPLAVRLLGVDGRGEVALALATVLLCSQVGLVGLPAAITFYGSDGRTPVWRILGSVRRPLLVQCGAAAVASVLALEVLSRVGSGTGVPGSRLVVVGVGTVAVMLARVLITGLQAEHRLRAFAVTQPLPAFVYAVALVVLLLTGLAEIGLVLVLYVAAWCLTAVVGGRLLRRGAQAPPTGADPPDPRDVLRFGRHAAVAAASPTDQFGIDQLLVGALLGHLALGFYSIGLAFESATLLPLLFLGTFVGPRIARLPMEQRMGVARDWLLRSVALGVLTCVVAQLLLPTVLPLAFGREAEDAVPVAHLLALAGTVLGQRNINNVALQAVGAPASSTRVELVAFTVMVLGVVLLGNEYGVEGAALGLVIAGLTGIVLQAFVFWRLARARRAGVSPLEESGTATDPSPADLH